MKTEMKVTIAAKPMDRVRVLGNNGSFKEGTVIDTQMNIISGEIVTRHRVILNLDKGHARWYPDNAIELI